MKFLRIMAESIIIATLVVLAIMGTKALSGEENIDYLIKVVKVTIAATLVVVLMASGLEMVMRVTKKYRDRKIEKKGKST
jgi:hypothetical protein